MTAPISTLQILADEIERRAIAHAHASREPDGWAEVDQWPYGTDDREKEDARACVVRSLFAVVDKVSP